MSKQHEKAISVLDRLEMIAAQGVAMISPELV